MKKPISSLSLHNFLNENIPNLVNLREKTEVIKVKIGVKRHCSDRNLKTKTAVLSEFNNKLTNRHAQN